jgi:O-antigen/teichoic acid export membrane protein
MTGNFFRTRRSSPALRDESLVLAEQPDAQSESTARVVGDPGSSLHWVPRALAYSFANSLISRLGTVGIGIALARLLGPEEFGTYAVAFVALVAILSFNELGVSLAVVRWTGYPEGIAPTVTTLSLASSATLALGMFFIAPSFTAAMGEPDATRVVQVLGLTVIFSGAVATPAAFMQRDFRQGTRLIIEQVGVWTGAVTSLVLALAGKGAMSLAIGRLTGSLLSAILFVLLSPVRYRIGWDRTLVVPLLKFGLPLAGASVIVFAMGYTDQLVVGRLLGPVALGFYALAYNLSSWPVSMFSLPLRNVAPPTFARLQDEPAKMASIFTLVARLLMVLTLPVCFVIAGAARSVVLFVYGGDWAPAAPILSIMAVLSALKVFFELTYDYLVVLRATGRVLMLQVASVVVLIPALVVGATLEGTVGVAAGQVIVCAVLVLPLYLLQLRRFGVAIRPIAQGLRLPVVVATVAGLSAYTLGRIVPSSFVASVLSGLVTLVATLILLLRSRAAFTRLLALMRGNPQRLPGSAA